MKPPAENSLNLRDIYKILRRNDEKFELAVLITILLASLIFLTNVNFIPMKMQLFIFQAQAFLSGQLNFLSDPEFIDQSVFQGKVYMPYGPLPALVLVPILLLFKNFSNQSYLYPLINLVNFCLLFRILKTLKLRTNNILWLCLAFFVASPYIYVGAAATTFHQLMGLTFMLAALLAHFRGNKPLLVGGFLAMAILCRYTLILSAPYFVACYFLEKRDSKDFIQKVLRFGLPVFLGLLTLFLFNYARFGNVFETGHKYIIDLRRGFLDNTIKMFSFSYLYHNLYQFFLLPPKIKNIFPYLIIPRDGIGCLFISPYLMCLLKGKYRDWESRLWWFSIILALIPLALFYSAGGNQLSFRYAIDFLPFVFLLLAKNFKDGLPIILKGIILVDVIWVWFLFYAYMINVGSGLL